MKIEISPKNFDWLMRGFIGGMNHDGAQRYMEIAFELAHELIEAADELTAEEKKELSDTLWVIAYPKGGKAKRILERREQERTERIQQSEKTMSRKM